MRTIGGITMKEIGKRIRALREQRGIKAKELAEAIGASQGNISDWENDKKKSTPTAKSLIAIASFFDVSLDWLMTGEEYSIKQESLSSDENELLQLFRKLSLKNQMKVLGYMESMISSSDHQQKKENSLKSTHGEEAATNETA